MKRPFLSFLRILIVWWSMKTCEVILSWIMLYFDYIFDYVFVKIVELNFFENKNAIIWFH